MRLQKALEKTLRIKKFELEVLSDNGERRIHKGIRVIQSRCLGPSKGGVRFHTSINERELVQLAQRILLKCAVNGLPHGGAAGGVVVDPKGLSEGEKERIARAYVDALYPDMGPEIDILSPDMGTDSRTMAWMSDQYNKKCGARVLGAVNGKPPELGGILGRATATADGAWIVLKIVLQEKGLMAENLSFSVQGFGNAGGQLARKLCQQGMKMVGASDSSGGWFNPEGLNAEWFWEQKQKGKKIHGIAVVGGKKISSTDVLTTKADIVIPAAMADQIDENISEKMQCRMILEIANAPTTEKGEMVLSERGIEIIPDVVANAGGITMSHFEWLQNQENTTWTLAEAQGRLESKMTDTAFRMVSLAKNNKVTWVQAVQTMAEETLSQSLGTRI